MDLWVRQPSEVELAPDVMEGRTSADRPSGSGDIARAARLVLVARLAVGVEPDSGPGDENVSGLSLGEACGSHAAHALWQLRFVERTLDRNAGGRGHAAQRRDEPVR
ncbi:hypothetical protein [Streptomyces sp. NBC_01718]|uniref:hypothetical protein n=1 Tax=unclassified Streptomyces TaxID=2593676 RepID=UPI0030E58384